jgi:hypothetical protein
MLTYLLRTLLGQETCPVCSERFRLMQAPFYCTNDASLCAPESDAVYARLWKDPAPRSKVIAPPSPFARKAPCHGCGQTSRRRLCPHCHTPLPRTVGELKSYNFALVGAKEAGKSHYIASFINQWRKTLGPAMNMELTWEGEETQKRYERDFYDPVYKKKQTITGTRSASASLTTRLPLIYRLTVHGKGWFGLLDTRKAVNLAFYDSAGEDLDDLSVMSNVNKYIYRADGIILLLDPLQLPRVREQLACNVPLPNENSEALVILERIGHLIRDGRVLKTTDRIKTPLAVAFSKLDAIESLLGTGSALLADADHTQGFDLADSNAVSGEMEAQIAKWHGNSLLAQVRNNFPRHRFFGLSALGCNPDPNGHIPRVLPRRVEDPLLWLLNLHGLIRSRKEV